MDVLIVGGGGREHAIALALSGSPRVDKLYCAPGNGGIAGIAECRAVKAADMEGLLRLAGEIKPGLVFVAPDDPLAMGLVDMLEANGFRAFGPRKDAAIL